MSRKFNIFRIRFNGIERMASRRLGKVPDESPFKIGDFFIFLGGSLLFTCYIPSSVEYNVELNVGIGLLLLLLGGFLNFRRLAPRPCWQRALRTGAILSVLWPAVTWICYWCEIINFRQSVIISFATVVWLLITIVALFRWRYIRRRSLQTIIRLRLERKRQRNYNF
jgi:hypothetical protein